MTACLRQRTGRPRIDALLEQFIAADPSIYTDTGEDPPLSFYRTCDEATGNCHNVAGALRDFIEDRDDELAVWDSDESPMLDRDTLARLGEHDLAGGLRLDDLGYEDRPVRGAACHTTTMIYDGEELYSVDFTARQFGYRSFPLVQRRVAGVWQRCW